MEEASQLTLAALTPFKPELSTSASGESPLKILGRLASPISRPAPKFIKGASVSDQISADTVEFADDKTGLITWHSATKQSLLAVLGLKAWGALPQEKRLADYQ